MSNDSADADGTIASRVALDEFEVDHFCGGGTGLLLPVISSVRDG
jgi:hypothetical protein